MPLGIMKGGPGDDVQFNFLPGAKLHPYLIPNNPWYKLAIYQITDVPTVLGEHLALFSHCIKRRSPWSEAYDTLTETASPSST